MSALPGVSIVVNNYNLAPYLGVAIESALAQDHTDVDVIVVDDCSTDGSREVIARYEGQVRTVLRESNSCEGALDFFAAAGKQLAALNSAWPLARHPILMFLDADDALLPHAASTVAHAWTPSTAKVQFCLASIDAAGRPLGHILPKYPQRLDTATIRAEILRTGSSPSAQGSGNAYARWLLDRLAADDGFVPPPGGVFWMDAILEVNAPFYGEVVTLAEPLVYYRVHEGNWTQQGELVADRFSRMAEFFDRKLTYLAGRCRRWGIAFDPEAARERSLWYAECVLAGARLTATGIAAFERPSIGTALRACAGSPFSLRQKLFRGLWIVAVVLLPRVLVVRLIEPRFVVARRPMWLERLATGQRKKSISPRLPAGP